MTEQPMGPAPSPLPFASLPPFPFPFFGAGEAAYFEWAEVHVRFARELSPDEQEAIEARVPPPLRDSIDWSGPQLMVASDQAAHLHIAESYLEPVAAAEGEAGAGEDGGPPDQDPEELDPEERFFFATDAQVHSFNQHIQDWLLEAHAICPILCAYRQEDMEAGGTELSPWHLWSMQQLPALLPHLQSLARPGSDQPATHMVRGILSMAREAGQPLPEELLDWLEPGRREIAALRSGDLAALRPLLDPERCSTEALDALGKAASPEGSDAALLLQVSDQLLAREELPESLLSALVLAAAGGGGAAPEAARRVLAAASQRASLDPAVTDQLGYLAFKLAREDRFREALAIFDCVVEAPGKDLSTFCNALWTVMADNNHLPLDPERARRYLAGCLPHGPENPAIYYNAACVLFELGELASVFDNLRQARDRGYGKPKLMRDEPLFRPIADDPRFREIFADLEEPEASPDQITPAPPSDGTAKKPGKSSRAVAGKPVVGKAAPAKPTTRKSAAKKRAPKKGAARKAAPKKPAPSKPAKRKTTSKKPAPSKPAKRKTTSKKRASKSSPGKAARKKPVLKTARASKRR